MKYQVKPLKGESAGKSVPVESRADAIAKFGAHGFTDFSQRIIKIVEYLASGCSVCIKFDNVLVVDMITYPNHEEAANSAAKLNKALS